MDQPRPVEETVREILRSLCQQNVSKIVISGAAGAGKTWVARKVCQSALQGGISCGSIWIAPAENPERRDLLEIIASQLCLSVSTEWDDDEDSKVVKDSVDMDPTTLKQKILDKLGAANPGKPRAREVKEAPAKTGKKRSEELTGEAETERVKYLFVVLDGITEKEEDSIVPNLEKIIPPRFLKMLITRKKSSDGNAGAASEGKEDEPIQVQDPKAFLLESFGPGEALALLQERLPEAGTEASGGNLQFSALAERALNTPARVILIAEALRHISRQDGGRRLKHAIEDLANLKGDVTTGVLRFAYEVLPQGVTRSCYWLTRELFNYRDAVHFNELITYWILEGCFDHHNRIEKAYEEGYHVLIELKDRGILKGHSSYVYFERAMLELPDERKNGFSGAMKLGLADVLRGKGLGRVTLADGMIRTVCRDKEKKDVSTLVIDGSSLSKEVSEEFLGSMKGLKVLAVLNPLFESLPPGLSELKDLQVIVLRGCQHLKDAGGINKLTNLLVLEISGAPLLKEIDQELFRDMANLKSVNLSGLCIESVRASLFELGEVRLLIIRDCPNFVELPSLKHMKKLQMVDLCGSALFERLSDGTISTLTDLKTLNISGTKVRNLPILGKLTGVTRILMSDCLMLTMVRSLREMTNLEVLDISGSTGIKDLGSTQLQNKGRFRILDLSKTGIVSLPANISNLSYLNLNDCCELQKLPSTNAFRDLVVLDLSGAVKLAELSDTSFEHLKFLRKFNLTGSKIEKLPSLSHLVELRELMLKDCKRLTELEGLSSLEKLEFLDLSGCCSLTNIGEVSFKAMARLKKLDLSATKIKALPEDCFPSNLCQLILRDCKILKQLPSLGSLSKLEELDLGGAESLAKFKADFLHNMAKLKILNLSKTQVEDLPSLSHLKNLRQLSLSGCSCVPSGLEALKELRVLDLSSTKVQSLLTLRNHSKLRELLLNNCSDLHSLTNLESLSHLEVLNLSGAGLKRFPDEVIHLTYLRELHLPNLKNIQVDWSKIKSLPADFKWDTPKKSKTKVAALASNESHSPSILIRGTDFFRLLEENSELWDTCFKGFHFSVWLPNEEGVDEIMKMPGDMSLFEYLFPRERFPDSQDCCLLEIHGSGAFPGELRNALRRARYISVIENATISCISELGEEYVGSIKSCWLERCSNMHCIFTREEDTAVWKGLTSLYLCNLTSLVGLCDEQLHSGIFSGLKHLHLDCCPKLVHIFSPSKLPANLETLKVKFCDMLETLVEDDGSAEPVAIPELRSLELFDLPELRKVGAAMPALEILKVAACENLHGSFSNLKTVEIESCPNLETGLSSS